MAVRLENQPCRLHLFVIHCKLALHILACSLGYKRGQGKYLCISIGLVPRDQHDVRNL